MSRLRQRARRGLLLQRLGGTLVCAAAGGVSLGALAWADGLAPAGPAAAGAVLAGLVAVLRFPWFAAPASELALAADADGLLRAALTVPVGHPFGPRLEAQASARRLRFRPLEDARPLLLWAAACLVLAVWMRAEPVFRPGLAGGGPVRPGSAAAGDPAAAAPASAGQEQAAADQATGDPPPPEPRSAAAAEAAEWWVVPLAAAPSAEAVIAARGHGSARGVVDRYLRLRNEEGS